MAGTDDARSVIGTGVNDAHLAMNTNHEAIFAFTGNDGTNHEPGTLRSPVLGTSTHAFAMVLQSTLPITL